MPRIAVTFAALVFVTLAVAGSAGAASVPPFPKLAGAWSHAEINVTIKHTPHTLILDRGLLVQVSPAQVTLRERDGSLVVVRLKRATIIRIYNVPASVFDLAKNMTVQTMRIDGGAAVRLRATI
jgi:hypothetical protein